jgi:hypothetical protein
MINEYQILLDAAKTLEEAKGKFRDEPFVSPAWRMLDRAQKYLLNDAEGVFRMVQGVAK